MTHSSPVCQQSLAPRNYPKEVYNLSPGLFSICQIGLVISDCFKLNFGVLQGSVLGPLLFSLYTALLVIAKYMDVKYYFYADDSQLFIHLPPGNCANSFHQLKACLNVIHTWLFKNKLKLNPGKTLYIVWFLRRSTNGSRTPSLSTFWETASVRLMLYAIWVYYLTQNLVSPIR